MTEHVRGDIVIPPNSKIAGGIRTRGRIHLGEGTECDGDLIAGEGVVLEKDVVVRGDVSAGAVIHINPGARVEGTIRQKTGADADAEDEQADGDLEIPSGSRIAGPLVSPGTLRFHPSAQCEGDVLGIGGVHLDRGTRIQGDVATEGLLHIESDAVVEGHLERLPAGSEKARRAIEEISKQVDRVIARLAGELKTDLPGDLVIPAGSRIAGALEVQGAVRLGKGAHCQGGLAAARGVVLEPDAVVEGDLRTGALVHIEPSARVGGVIRPFGEDEAKAALGDVHIPAGSHVTGKLRTTGILHLGAGSTFDGDVFGDRGLILEEGVVVHGSLNTKGEIRVERASRPSHEAPGTPAFQVAAPQAEEAGADDEAAELIPVEQALEQALHAEPAPGPGDAPTPPRLERPAAAAPSSRRVYSMRGSAHNYATPPATPAVPRAGFVAPSRAKATFDPPTLEDVLRRAKAAADAGGDDVAPAIGEALRGLLMLGLDGQREHGRTDESSWLGHARDDTAPAFENVTKALASMHHEGSSDEPWTCDEVFDRLLRQAVPAALPFNIVRRRTKNLVLATIGSPAGTLGKGADVPGWPKAALALLEEVGKRAHPGFHVEAMNDEDLGDDANPRVVDVVVKIDLSSP